MIGLLPEVPLFLEAFWMLLRADAVAKAGYARLSRRMHMAVAGEIHPNAENAITAIVTAVRRACRYYPKSPACLQRSLALVWMLRKRGIAADLQIGVRQSPFESHAWVEIAGNVINDVPAVREAFEILHEFTAREPSALL